jgi:hypothetical protein
MAQHQPDRPQPHEADSEYSDELLSANWNPVIELIAWSCRTTLELARSEEPPRGPSAGETDEDADAFLARVYLSGM